MVNGTSQLVALLRAYPRDKLGSDSADSFESMRSVLRPAMVLAALFLSGPAAAADAIEELIVSGARVGAVERLDRLGRDQNAAEIGLQNTDGLLSSLRFLPGVQVSQPGGLAGRPFLSVRGGEPNFTLVLVDGVRVNDPTDTYGGAFEFGLMPTEFVERVEIFPGAYSPVYGPDALSGVISITTKPARAGLTQWERSAAVAGDSDGGASGYASIAGAPSDSFGVRLSAAARDRQTPGTPEHIKDSMFQFRTITEFGQGGKFETTVHYASLAGSSYPQASGGPLFASTQNLEDRQRDLIVGSAKAGVPLSGSCQLRGDASVVHSKETVANPGIPEGVLQGTPAFESRNRLMRSELTSFVVCDESSGPAISAGGALIIEDGESRGTLDLGVPVPSNYAIVRRTPAVFAEIKLRGRKVGLSAAARSDFPKGGSAKLTYSARAAYAVGADTEISGSMAKAFHLPSFFAVGSPLVGNPDLQPETGTSVDIGIRHAIRPGVEAQLQVFQQNFRNLIDFDPDLFLNVNRTLVRARGAEMTLEWTPSEQFSMSGWIARTSTVRRDIGEQLALRARWTAALLMSAKVSRRITLSTQSSYVGARFDSSIPTGRIKLDGYVTTNLSGALAVTDRVAAVASVENVLSANYTAVAGVPGTGRLIRITVRAGY